MRRVSPLSSTGGFLRMSSRRFCGLPNPNPETRTSAWTWTLLSLLPTTETSPATLLNSSRMGPETSRERSKLPETDGPMEQPAKAKAKIRSAMCTACLRCRVIAPPAPTVALSKPSLIDTQIWEKMFRIPRAFGTSLPRKAFIQRALPVAFEIQRNVGEARGFQARRNQGSHFPRHCARHFFRGDLDARKLFV